MNCETLQRAIDERRPGDTAGLPGDLAAHLEGCPACQAYAAGVAAIGRALAHCRDLTASLPEAELLAARERIAEAVAARRAVAAVRRRPSFPAPADPLLVWGMGLAVLLLAAFIGVLAWPRRPVAETLNSQRSMLNAQVPSAFSVERSAFNVLPPDPAAGQPATTPPDPAPVSTTLAEKPAAILQEPQLTGLPAFRAEYEALKASGKGIAPGFLQRFACYLEGPSRTLDERLQGWELLCEACEEAGEKKMAVDAFGRHLDAYEEHRAARNALKKPGPRLPPAPNYAITKVTRVFYGDKDKFGALAYGDLILARYPDSPEVDQVQMLIGEYYESTRNYDAGIRQMQAIMELRPDTPLARQAKENLARMLYNAQRKDEALAAWQELAETGPADTRALSYYQLGISAHACGPRYYTHAMKYLQLAIRHDNQQGWGDEARKLLARINAQMMGDPTRI